MAELAYFRISKGLDGKVEIQELKIEKETPKTVQVSCKGFCYTFRKSQLPYVWTATKSSLIVTDIVSGKSVWNEHIAREIEKYLKKLDELSRLSFAEEGKVCPTI